MILRVTPRVEGNLKTEIYYDKVCEICGKPFRSRSNRAKYCKPCLPIAERERDKRRAIARRERALFADKTEIKRNMNVVEAAKKCKELGVSYGVAVSRGLV